MTSIHMQTPLAARQQQCARIAAKHGDGMLPIVLQAVGSNAKTNYTALPASATVADLVAAIREVGDVSKKSACALQVSGCTPSSTTTIGDLHAACKNEDGFLYVTYAGERTMGCGMVPGDSGASGEETGAGAGGAAGGSGGLGGLLGGGGSGSGSTA